MRYLVAVLVSFGMASCGYTLQGSQSLPSEVRALHIDMRLDDQGLEQALRRALSERGVVVKKNAASELAELEILRSDTGERILSVSSSAGPEEYELYHVVDFRFVKGSELLLEVQTVSVTRDYSFDKENLLGNAEDAARLKAALLDDISQLIINRLASVK